MPQATARFAADTIPPEEERAMAGLSRLERDLINAYQHGLPLVPAPFAEMGKVLGVGEGAVLETLEGLDQRGVLSRVGPVFRPHTLGASTLAALAVPPERLEAVGQWVSRFREINHNYEREHSYNLWFVIAAGDRGGLDGVLGNIREETGLAPLDLPLLRDFHIDLGFSLDRPVEGDRRARNGNRPAERMELGARERALVAAIQDGVALVPRPFARAGEAAGLSETQVLEWLRAWQAAGVLKRMGLVVRHQELGYHANGMVVWDIPEDDLERVGQDLARHPCVTLCYHRPRRGQDWPYNLFTMIHGRDRSWVRARAGDLAGTCRVAHRPREILFSRRCFKQRGARYG